MAAGFWDVNARNELFGVINQRAVRAVGRLQPAQPADALRVYANIHGNLSVEIR